MFLRCTTLALTFVFASALSLSAADQEKAPLTATPISDAVARTASDTQPGATLWTLSQRPKLPAMLPVLYGAYVGLQVMDIVSTRRAISAGAHEANPLFKKGGMGTTLAIKAASAVGMVYISEKTWKKHRVGSIVLMAAVNGISMAVVANNTRNAARR